MEKVTYNVEFGLYDPDAENEAFASISLNPALTWTKFVLTDDKPNLNLKRIPETEFDNLIRTGIYMPIKMAEGEIKDGHDGAIPLGVISHLKKTSNQIQGLAALWERERPEDVKYIKERYANKQPLQLSWEVYYEREEEKEDGTSDLIGTALRAVTLVGMPAYAGRTPITEVASIKEQEETKLEELEQLKSENETLKASLTAKEEELTRVTAELETLKEFKASIEKEEADAEKLDAIKKMFKEAGLEKDESYFAEKKDMLLSLSPEALDFLLQEAISFASVKDNKKNTSNSSTEIPPLNGGKSDFTKQELAEFLRARHLQK